MAHVEKRGPGRWRARYRAPDGRERSQTFDRKVNAERWLSTQEADKARGTWIDPSRGRVTFDRWSSDWLGLHVALKPKTRAGYEGILRTHLIPAFGGRRLASIEPVEVRRFVAEMEAAGVAPRTVRNVYRVLSGIMRSAVANRVLPYSPCAEVALPRPARREMQILTSDEVQRLSEAAGPYKELVLFAAYTGMRWGEIAALRVGHVDPLRLRVDVVESASEVAGEVLYVAPKSGRSRSLSLPRALFEEIAPLLEGKTRDALVFSGKDGAPLRHGAFYGRAFRPAVTRAGLPETLRFHDLRHTCASLLIAQGAHPRAIMERLGHSSITVTMDVYGHLLPSLDDALSAGLDAAFRGSRAASLRPERGQVIPLGA